jgi:serine protease AprX
MQFIFHDNSGGKKMTGISIKQHFNLMNNQFAPISGLKKTESNENSINDQITLSDMVSYKAEDLTPQNTVKVIIESENKNEIENIKKEITKNHKGKIIADLSIINGIAVELNPNDKGVIPILQENHAKIIFDSKVEAVPEIDVTDSDVTATMDVASKTMNADKMWEKGFTGKGKTICIIDTGIDPHPDYKDRIIGFKDYTTEEAKEGAEFAYDDQGHGTHCAGIAVGDGKSSDGKFKGIAPEANIVGVKVLDKNGVGSLFSIVLGIQWAIEHKEQYGIDVISLSLGGNQMSPIKDDPIAQCVEAAVKAGITTIVAAGNSGPNEKTICSPGVAPSVITIAALDDKGTVERNDDDIAKFSSRGPTKMEGDSKPDVATPGVKITACKPGGGYQTMSGTSMATPFAAGLTLLLKQAVPEATPEKIKDAVKNTADKLPGQTQNDQGAGVYDVVEAYEKLTGKKL